MLWFPMKRMIDSADKGLAQSITFSGSKYASTSKQCSCTGEKGIGGEKR